MLCCDISMYCVRCRWLFAEITVNNMGYACSAIAWASRMLELLREEEEGTAFGKGGHRNCPPFPL